MRAPLEPTSARVFAALLCVGAQAFYSSARAQEVPVAFTEWGLLESVSSAWKDDALGVHHNAPFVNSGVRGVAARTLQRCKVTDQGYATDPGDPGHKLHHALIIGAFLHEKQVRFVLQGCVFNKPRIISVEVR
jgi:hypothetical protein